VLSRRAKLSVSTRAPIVAATELAPEKGHETARVSVRVVARDNKADHLELGFRPAYHDFRDPGKAYGTNAAIDFFHTVIARDLETDQIFLRQLRIIGIESIEPRGDFFKPISWHTRLDWERPDADAPHRFTFNVGAGGAWQLGSAAPVVFALFEADVIDDPSFSRRVSLQLGFSGGLHWEPLPGWRLGIEADVRQRVDDDFYTAEAELWGSLALGTNLALVLDASVRRAASQPQQRDASAQLRVYF